MNFSFFYKIFLAIVLFISGVVIGLGFEESYHRLLQWTPTSRQRIALKTSFLESDPASLILKLQTNPRLNVSWRFPEILLFLQKNYIKKQEKLEEIQEWAKKEFYQTSLYPFWRLKWNNELYKAGYKSHAKKMLQKIHPLDFWIEPELLKQAGSWAYQEEEKTIAFNSWETLEKKFPFSKAFKEIKKDFSILKNQKKLDERMQRNHHGSTFKGDYK